MLCGFDPFEKLYHFTTRRYSPEVGGRGCYKEKNAKWEVLKIWSHATNKQRLGLGLLG